MKISAIQKTMGELQRYVDTVEALQKEGHLTDDSQAYRASKHTGAVRRASLELSRALSALRNPT